MDSFNEAFTPEEMTYTQRQGIIKIFLKTDSRTRDQSH